MEAILRKLEDEHKLLMRCAIGLGVWAGLISIALIIFVLFNRKGFDQSGNVAVIGFGWAYFWIVLSFIRYLTQMSADLTNRILSLNMLETFESEQVKYFVALVAANSTRSIDIDLKDMLPKFK